MEAQNLFGSVIWKGHYDGDLSVIHRRCENLLTNSKRLNTGLERDGGYSSSSDPDAPHRWRAMDEFFNWVSPNVQEVWKDFRYPPGNVFPANSWTNIHPNGAWTDEHQHGITPLVIVLYVNQPENGGNLEVFNPLFYNWSGTIRESGQDWAEIPVQTGDVLMFPGWLLHRTQPNQSDENRYVISINMSVDILKY